ncbi:MAG: PQQ-binding-like beta-propeller repeat protein [Alphaproteobacteria bacterium]|nr:PQQ-binding-like beta-propeller repeat protein [Alphaproteobacteria bacterium]
MAWFRRLLIVAAAASALAGCENWFGETEAPPLPGARIAVMLEEGVVEPDPRLADLDVRLPPPYLNTDWPQAGGYADHAMHHLMVGENLEQVWDISIGEGSDGGNRILNTPIVANGKVVTKDSEFIVRAFDAETGGLIWEFDPGVPEEDEDAFGGGVAYHDGRIFLSTGYAQLIAVDAKDGVELWRAALPGPMRAAPTAADMAVLAITIDNQTSAFNPVTGERLWVHSGFAETAGLLGGASPAIDGPLAIVPYSSGEVFGLRLGTGRPVWSDSLTSIRRADALSALADIRGLPVIDRGLVLAVSHAGRTVALDARSGQRVWDLRVGGRQSPWVAGEFIYLLTTEGNLLAVTRRGGRVKWVVSVPIWEDAEDRTDAIAWVGPVLAGDRLILGNSLGELVSVSPYTGEALGGVDVGDPILTTPIVANGTLYVQTDDGRLIAFR